MIMNKICGQGPKLSNQKKQDIQCEKIWYGIQGCIVSTAVTQSTAIHGANGYGPCIWISTLPNRNAISAAILGTTCAAAIIGSV